MGFDPALGALDALPREAPQQPLTLKAVGGGLRVVDREVVGGRAADRVDERLKGLLIYCLFLLLLSTTT